MPRNHFKRSCRLVEEYLDGKRKNPMICTKQGIAMKLSKRYNVKMIESETVDVEVGLYMYEIVR